jgi:hypothetical protein
MEADELYGLVIEAVREALDDAPDVRIAKRMLGGRVIFEDDQGRQFKEVPAIALFKKVTSVREKLRVLEQKLNNHPHLDEVEKAELQGHLTRCYGSLTTFNFLFREDRDKFEGSGG